MTREWSELTWQDRAEMGRAEGGQHLPRPAHLREAPGRPANICRHCARYIEKVGGLWIDPEASGDDLIWRETCDAHDTFEADHEPEESVADSDTVAISAPGTPSPVVGTGEGSEEAETGTQRLWCPSCGVDEVVVVVADGYDDGDGTWRLGCVACGWGSRVVEDAFTSAGEVLEEYRDR